MGESVTRAVILAAGRGKRMRELTSDVPKPMVLVARKPVVQYIVEGLRRAGVKQVLMIVGYRKQAIIDYFGDGSGFGLEIEYVEQVTQDGTGKVVELAKDFSGQNPFVLSYGDILVDPSCYISLVNPFDAEMLLTVRRMEDVSQGGAVYLNGEFEVVDLKEKQFHGQANTPWYNAGIYIFKPVLFEFTARLEKSPRGEYELTDAIIAMLGVGHRFAGLEIQGRWVDVRDPEVLASLEKSQLD